ARRRRRHRRGRDRSAHARARGARRARARPRKRPSPSPPPARPLITVDLAAVSPAVLVIDMQIAFISPDGAFGNDAGDLIERLNPFLDRCRELEVPVIFSSYLLRGDLKDAGLLAGNEAAAHFADTAPGAAVDPRIRRAPSDLDCR